MTAVVRVTAAGRPDRWFHIEEGAEVIFGADRFGSVTVGRPATAWFVVADSAAGIDVRDAAPGVVSERGPDGGVTVFVDDVRFSFEKT